MTGRKIVVASAAGVFTALAAVGVVWGLSGGGSENKPPSVPFIEHAGAPVTDSTTTTTVNPDGTVTTTVSTPEGTVSTTPPPTSPAVKTQPTAPQSHAAPAQSQAAAPQAPAQDNNTPAGKFAVGPTPPGVAAPGTDVPKPQGGNPADNPHPH